MKLLILPFLLAITQVTLIAADAPAPLKPFDKTHLTPAQLAACAAFKAKDGKERHDEAKALSGIFTEPYMQDGKPTGIMHPTALITRDDVINLLGKPGATKEGSLFYSLGATDDSGAVDFAFDKDGHLTMVMYIDL